jgi:hypothetical protein
MVTLCYVGVMESLVRRYAAMKPHLTERQRRVWLGAEARELGSGGVGMVAEAVSVSVSPGHCQVDRGWVFGRCVAVWTSMGAWTPRRRCTEVTGSRWRSLATVCGCITGSR